MKKMYIFFSALCAFSLLNVAPALAKEAQAPVEEPKTDTVNVFTNLYNVLDHTDDIQGIWMIQALDYEMSEYEVVLVVKSKTFVGTYTEQDLLYTGNNMAPLTCIYLQNTNKKGDDDLFLTVKIRSGHGVVYDKGNIRTFDFFLDAEDGKVYHLLVSYEWFTLELDAEEDFSSSYSRGSIWTEDGGVALVVSDAQSRIGMMFYVDDPAVAKIPAGTYTVSADKTPGTVLASLGVDKVARTLAPSYVATIDSDGKAGEMWFLVSGTVVVVENDGMINFTVDALNSKGKRVQADISFAPTAIQGVEADTRGAVKTVRNGRIVILRDGRMFNLDGNPVND